MDGEAKCNCQQCGQPIAFPVDLHNTDFECPHCGRFTRLIAVAIPATAPVRSTASTSPAGPGHRLHERAEMISGCALLFLVLGILAGAITLIMTSGSTMTVDSERAQAMTLGADISGGLLFTCLWLWLLAEIVHIRASLEK